jgi:hypothetical protein
MVEPILASDALPVELFRVVLTFLDPHSLTRVGASCRDLESLSNEVAQASCKNDQKALWCLSMSWRVQLWSECYGRMFRPSTKILRQHGSAGTRRAAASSARTLNKPVAVAVLPGGRAAVCNFGSRSVSVMNLVNGCCLGAFKVDGAPSGITLLECHLAGVALIAVSLQGTAESGEVLPGVVNPIHRVEAYAIPHSLAVGEIRVQRLWVSEGVELSYPNGVAACPSGWLYVSSWNDHRVVALDTSSVWGATATTLDGASLAASNGAALDRPADVVALPCSYDGQGPTLAVADYYGKAVQLYHPSDDPLDGFTMCGTVGAKRRSRQSPSLSRPSSLAVAGHGPDWARLLIAETGAMCISVFHISREESRLPRAHGLARFCSRHICDICVEQVGSGLHAPQRGLWGWLGVACAPSGDVVVSDCDNDCLLVI